MTPPLRPAPIRPADRPGGAAFRIASIGECMIELSGVTAEHAAIGVAGDSFNTAVYLGRALDRSAAQVSYVTALGTDSFSDRIVACARAEGIDTRHMHRVAGALPGLYAIELDPEGDRRFQFWRSASAARRLFSDGIGHLDDLDAFDMVYLSAITLAILPAEVREALVAKCAALRRGGHHVVFDSNYRPQLWPDAGTARDWIDRMWRATTIALPSRDDEARLRPDEAPQALLERLAAAGVAEIALKDGAAGPWLWHEGPLARQTYPAAPRVVDTTAAGDSFNAGYLAARIAGSNPIDAARAGHELAMQVIGQPGALIPRPA
ncbi:sugar kinase [Limimaricola pyoseonensis]|uniref:2-dehydro-3-deoxygluconokinase n=1 Tax=Limimaricola pyoseonensis TaxID=521013 RepID=A0A1G7EXQ1_9RHOB|nr:sugar kinase [Limimaricola pyoseonensis]SDE68483.1 2-dehydro-3-deoxygluconokinase [Limimaricola pyoseonensis]